MRAVARLDAEGFYVEPVMVDGPLPPGHAEITPFVGLHWPRWDGTRWEEGKPEADILTDLKAAKVGELADAAIDSLSPMFTPNAGRDETALLVASHVLKICEALKIQPDPRLVAVVETGQKALQKKAEVEGAGTVEELEGVSWT